MWFTGPRASVLAAALAGMWGRSRREEWAWVVLITKTTTTTHHKLHSFGESFSGEKLPTKTIIKVHFFSLHKTLASRNSHRPPDHPEASRLVPFPSIVLSHHKGSTPYDYGCFCCCCCCGEKCVMRNVILWSNFSSFRILEWEGGDAPQCNSVLACAKAREARSNNKCFWLLPSFIHSFTPGQARRQAVDTQDAASPPPTTTTHEEPSIHSSNRLLIWQHCY